MLRKFTKQHMWILEESFVGDEDMSVCLAQYRVLG